MAPILVKTPRVYWTSLERTLPSLGLRSRLRLSPTRIRPRPLENLTLSAVTILIGLFLSPWDPTSLSPVAFSCNLFFTLSCPQFFFSLGFAPPTFDPPWDVQGGVNQHDMTVASRSLCIGLVLACLTAGSATANLFPHHNASRNPTTHISPSFRMPGTQFTV